MEPKIFPPSRMKNKIESFYANRRLFLKLSTHDSFNMDVVPSPC